MHYTSPIFQKLLKKYMDYYSNYRGQWNLKKMTRVKYRDHLLRTA
ncbi:IS3 family transposase [Clostridium botulinum]